MPTKKALLIGINYTGQANALKGCINDAWNVAHFLVNNWGYEPGNIRVLSDDPDFHGGGLPKFVKKDESKKPAKDDKKDDKKDKKDKKEGKDDKKDKKDDKKDKKDDKKDKKGKDDKKEKKDKKDKEGKDKKDKKDKKGKKEKKKGFDLDIVAPEDKNLAATYEVATREITDESLTARGEATFQRGSATKEEIIAGCKWLLSGAASGDYLFFHYSGHGIQIDDATGDEKDGKDEAICPQNFRAAGLIVDDELHALLVKPLPDGAHLTAIMDCCHSGTALDLPFEYDATAPSKPPKEELKVKKKEKKKKKGKEGKEKKDKKDKKEKDTTPAKPGEHKGGVAIMLSGCEDHQVSADVNLEGSSTGAMSFAFITTLTKHSMSVSYVDLLYDIKALLKERVRNVQYPLLTTNVEHFDFGRKFEA